MNISKNEWKFSAGLGSLLFLLVPAIQVGKCTSETWQKWWIWEVPQAYHLPYSLSTIGLDAKLDFAAAFQTVLYITT